LHLLHAVNRGQKIPNSIEAFILILEKLALLKKSQILLPLAISTFNFSKIYYFIFLLNGGIYYL
jgi:hypothetical protein